MAKEPEPFDALPASFDALIDAVADGAPIDWARLEAGGRIAPRELQAARAIAGFRDASDPAVAPVARGFDKLEEIGHGAFGRVYRARDRVLGREVALKVLEDDSALTPEQRSRFLREARALAACEDENIVRIHSVEERDGHLELCLELLDGVTLEQFVRGGGPLSAVEAARIGSDLCHALAAMHSRGLVHRDVKPANVMRVRGGRIVLLDFGLTHAADPTRRTGSIAGGTPLFMAPELLAGASDVDGRVDLYSLGVTLYWLVTAKWPYEAASPGELLLKIEREPPIPLLDRRPDLPAAFVATVARALARERAARFASAGEMDAALTAVVAKSARVQASGWRPVARLAAAAVVLFSLITGWQARPIEAELRLDRAVAGTEETQFVPLAADATLTVGDLLIAELTLDRPAWVYGFDADRSDHFYAIFPLGDSTLRNPIPAGTTRLPGPRGNGGDESCTWKVGSVGIQESLFFFVAREPIPELQTMWEMCAKPGGSGGGSNGEALSGALQAAPTRGTDSTGVFRRVLSPAANRKLFDQLMRIAADQSLPGVTLLQRTYGNPGR